MPLSRRLWLGPLAILSAACNDPPTAPSPSTLIVAQAPSPVGVPGWILIDTLKVQAVDAAGLARSGVVVSWAVNGGGGSLQVTSDTTDAAGLAAAVWTLGPREGPNTVRATTLDDASVEFHSNGEAFRVDRLASSEWMGCGLVGSELWCWGDGFWGNSPPVSLLATSLGPRGWSSGPGLVDDLHEYVDVAVSGGEVCGLDRQSAVWCAAGPPTGLGSVAGLPPIRSVVGAGFSAPGKFCGLAVNDSTPWCWRIGGTPAQVAGSPPLTTMWMEVAYSTDFSFRACGLLVDSTAVCWGAGPLGGGSTGSSGTPVVVSGGHHFSELAVGVDFTCGRTSSMEIWCWGGRRPDLVPMLSATGAARIGADYNAVQLIGPSGAPVVRWYGLNFGTAYYPTGLTGLPAVSFSNNNFSCVRLVDGQVYCYDEMWNPGWSTIADMNYSAVQPLRPPAPAP